MTGRETLISSLQSLLKYPIKTSLVSRKATASVVSIRQNEREMKSELWIILSTKI